KEGRVLPRRGRGSATLGVGVAIGAILLAPALAQAQSLLPTGRESYRTYEEVVDEIHAIAAANPDRVKLFTLPHKTLLGRDVLGPESGHCVNEEVGMPACFNSGVHHAREWPTVEFTMELIHDLLMNDGT